MSEASQDKLPEIFYRVNDEIEDMELKLLHAELLGRMLHEHDDLGDAPFYSTMEKVMIERFVSFYIFMRSVEKPDLEKGRPVVDERKIKEMMKVWVEMAAQLHKQGVTAIDAEKVKQSIFDALIFKVAKAIDFIIKDPKEAADVKEALYDELRDFEIR